VKRVAIPKPDGGVRKLGLPTVLERFVQQAVMQVLQGKWERTFSNHSYGFRPGRSAHQALVSPVDEGTPQGGPLSPLLSNIVLDEFDQELERRGLRFARYADDCNVYVRSRRAGERVRASITRFITTKLKLKVNEQKSAVARPWERKFPGFSFTAKREPKRRLAPKAVLRFKEKVRELTRRTRGVKVETMAEGLGRYLRGWMGYFGQCQTPSVLQGLEEWTRRRLRSVLLTQRIFSSRKDSQAAIGVSCRTVARSAVGIAVVALRPDAVSW
jgi:RNA-directed DNA polymerase